jgi:uncharacterized protein (TIGR03086 family)
MDPFATLTQTGAGFERRLRMVAPEQWALPTPCEGWNVYDLVAHVVSANRMAVLLLAGASRDEAMAQISRGVNDGDLVTAYLQSSTEQLSAFSRPGAMEMTVHHPIGDVPGQQLLGFRIGDLLLHTWDLSRAIGFDEALDGDAVVEVWGQLSPLAEVIGQIGIFGAGPSGQIGTDATLQTRLLDLTGRRP